MKLLHYILIGFFSAMAIFVYISLIINQSKIARGNFKFVKLKGYKRIHPSFLINIALIAATGLVIFLLSGDKYVLLILGTYIVIISPVIFFNRKNCILINPEGIKPTYIDKVLKWEKIDKISRDRLKSRTYLLHLNYFADKITFKDEVSREEFLQDILHFQSDLYHEDLRPMVDH